MAAMQSILSTFADYCCKLWCTMRLPTWPCVHLHELRCEMAAMPGAVQHGYVTHAQKLHVHA